jgi:putative ABC transport system substrate-binding protein
VTTIPSAGCNTHRAWRARLLFVEATDERALEAAFKAAVRNKAGAVINMHCPGLDAYKARIVQLATSHRLPLMALFASFTADGALLSYGPNIEDLTSRMSVYADKILRGAIIQ